MNEKLAMTLAGAATAATGMAVGGYIGYKYGRNKNSELLKNILTMANLNRDIVEWVGNEGAALPWDEFAKEFNERLEYLALVANTINENLN